MGFEKGKSGNPDGRPRITEEFKQALSKSTMEALKVIRRVMNDPTARNFDRITAAKYVLDKSLGINFYLFDSEDEGEDNELVVRIVKAKDKKEKEK